MMHQGTRRFSQPQRLSERFYHIFCLQVFPNMVAHNFSGAGIGDQTQIGRTIAQRKVSNIGDPDLFWFKSGNLFRAWFKQVWMSVEAMMTVGSFVICPFYWHQESVFIEQVKQAVSPDIQPFIGLSAYSALFDHGLASKSDQRFASIRSTGNLTFSTAF